MGEQRLKVLGTEVRGGGHRDATVAAGHQEEAVLPHRVPGFSPGWRCRGKRDMLAAAVC